nr:PREDICTED: uncharacterized protein LOC108207150 [Daucus carota subsp. sativus]
MKQKVHEGDVIELGIDDVLTKVLGNPEHRGWVRGQGSYVKQSVYFNLPRQKRKSRTIEEKIQEGIQKFMSEETDRIIRDRDAFWAAEMAKLKEALVGKKLCFDGSPNIGSQQGSCSKGVLDNVELDLAARKKLDLNEDLGSAEGKDSEKDEFGFKDDVEGKKNIEETDGFQGKRNGEQKGAEVVVVDDPMDTALKNECPSLWELSIETPNNVVAHATVDMDCTVLHGKPIGKDNARVSITHVIQGAAQIPFPIEDEITTVEQAVGTFIAWPRNHLREVKATSDDLVKSRTVKGGKKNGARKMKKMNDLVSEPEYAVTMGPDFPVDLKKLWLWASDSLKDGRSHTFQLSEEAFGSKDRKRLFQSDMKALCFGGAISGAVICMFINVLQDNLRKHKMTDMITFVNPAKIGAIGCGTPAERSRALSLRFKNAKPGQVFLLPYHHTNHWALTVVNPDAQMVYHMDPLKRRIANEEWTEVVNNGIKIYKEDLKRFVKKKINWENLAGVPAQTGTTDCGLFLMHYMKEICLDKELKFATKWARRTNIVCDTDDLNEMKCTWAKYFMRQHAS